MAVPQVSVIRSGVVESVHQVDVAVADADGNVVAAAGDAVRMVFARSSMKPLQAAVTSALARLDLPLEELAVACASHNAEPVHLAAVRSLLARAGLDDAHLRTPARRPWDEETLAADPTPRSINSDCSGKHALMLAACVAQEWDVENYLDPGHPLQQRILDAVLAATELPSVAVGVDGCGAPVHRLPLVSMATLFARLVRTDRLGDLGGTAARCVEAMRAYPYMVAGRDRFDTALMEVAPHMVAKAGAEALSCVASVDDGLGVAVRVRDGAPRAGPPVMIRALRMLQLLDDEQVAAIEPFARPPVLGGGRTVGELAVELELEPPVPRRLPE